MPTIEKAREAGLLVIALDTPLDPINAADATFATDNFKAGELIGQWAAATLGDKADGSQDRLPRPQPQRSVRRRPARPGLHEGLRHRRQGRPDIGDEDDPRIVGHDVTAGNEEGGRKAMENLLQKDPDVNVVYTINEPAAAGAYEALKAVGREKDVLVVSVDGGCPGVKNVAGRRHRRDLDAVPAADGLHGRGSDRRVREVRQEARNHARASISSTPASS